ncbi:16065_t:CDS:2, partial [Racocetra fulgida]
DYNITWTDQIIDDSLPIETNTNDKPTISFYSDNTTPPPAVQNIFTDIKIQQAPFLIPPIYPGARFIVYCILEKGVEACKEILLSASSHDGPMKLSIPLNHVILKGSKIHTLAARKLIQDIEDGTSFIHKHPRNMGKSLPNSLIRKQIVKNIELMTEVKSLPGQKIVPLLDPPPLAANFYSQASPAAQSPSDANKNSTLAGYFSSLKAPIHIMYNLLMLLGSSHGTVPQFPESSDSAIQATDVSKISKTSFSSSPNLSNRSQLSSQPRSMSLNINLFGVRGIEHNYAPNSTSAVPQFSAGNDSVIQAASLSKTSKAASLSSSPILSNRSRLSYQSRSMSLNDGFNLSRIRESDDSYESLFDDSYEIYKSFEPVLPAISVKSKPPKIETLYKFLDFQSFDGSFLPSAKFYYWFSKNDFKDFEVNGVENEKVLCLALAIAYLEIIIFETFKDECEMCYEKAKKALKKEVVGDDKKINEILEKAKEWVKMWADE